MFTSHIVTSHGCEACTPGLQSEQLQNELDHGSCINQESVAHRPGVLLLREIRSLCFTERLAHKAHRCDAGKYSAEL